MAFSEDEKNEIKRMVLVEIEKMFAEIGNRYNTKDNHEKMNFLLDIESAVKQGLIDADESEQSRAA